MTLIRTVHDDKHPYAILNLTIAKDNRLSAKAKGIWLYAFSQSNDWKFYLREMINHFSDGRDSISSGLKELESCGYLYRYQEKEEGRFGDYCYMFFETPKTEEEFKKCLPKTDFPDTADPNSGNPTLTSIKYNKYKKTSPSRASQNETCQPEPEPDPNEGLEQELGLVDLDLELGNREVEDALRSTGLEVEDCKKLWYTLVKQFGDTTIPQRLQAIRLTHEALKRNDKIQNPIAYMIAGCKKRLKEIAVKRTETPVTSKTDTHQCQHTSNNLNALTELKKWDMRKTEKGYLLHVGNDYVEFALGSHAKRFEVAERNFINQVRNFLKETGGKIL